MQQTSASEADAPLFATVTFVYSDGSTGSTFRVPITRETTVRRLAKDAMQRLVLSRRVTGQRVIPAIVVTEVFVRGAGSQPKAEVFAQDIVTQVVLVKEEVIFMAVQNQADVEAHPPPATTTTTGSISDVKHTGDSSSLSNTTSTAAVRLTLGATSATKTTQPPSPEAPRTATRRATSPAVRAEIGGGAAVVSKKATSPPASSAVPPTRSTTADKPMTHTLAEATTASVQTRKRRRDSDPAVVADTTGSSGDNNPSSTVACATAEMHGGDTIQRLREREMARLGWGPEAHKHFAANYVSSPEKLMRARFTRASRAKSAAAKANIHDTHRHNARKAAKQEAAHNAAVHTHSSSHHATRATSARETTTATVAVEPVTNRHELAEEDEVQVRLPKGWGPDALRLFPLNYVSSPDRLARQIRQRHKREKAEHKAHDTAPEAVVNVDDAEKEGASQGSVVVAHKVARQLHFSEAETQQEVDSPEGRPTVAHHASLRLCDETEAANAKLIATGDGSKGKAVHFATPVLTAQEFLRTRSDNRATAHTQ